MFSTLSTAGKWLRTAIRGGSGMITTAHHSGDTSVKNLAQVSLYLHERFSTHKTLLLSRLY